jgi:hypothetical protein
MEDMDADTYRRRQKNTTVSLPIVRRDTETPVRVSLFTDIDAESFLSFFTASAHHPSSIHHHRRFPFHSSSTTLHQRHFINDPSSTQYQSRPSHSQSTQVAGWPEPLFAESGCRSAIKSQGDLS